MDKFLSKVLENLGYDNVPLEEKFFPGSSVKDIYTNATGSIIRMDPVYGMAGVLWHKTGRKSVVSLWNLKNINESFVDGRKQAMEGIGIHSREQAKKYAGQLVDYYHPSNGDKREGKIGFVGKSHYVVKDHKDKTQHHFKYPEDHVKEEIEVVDEGLAKDYIKGVKHIAKDWVKYPKLVKNMVKPEWAKKEKVKEEIEPVEEAKYPQEVLNAIAVRNKGRDRLRRGQISKQEYTKNHLHPYMNAIAKHRLKVSEEVESFDEVSEASDFSKEGSHVYNAVYTVKNGDGAIHQHEFSIPKKTVSKEEGEKKVHEHFKDNPHLELHPKYRIGYSDSSHAEHRGFKTPMATHKVMVQSTAPGKSHRDQYDHKVKSASSKEDAVAQARKHFESKGHTIHRIGYAGTGL